MVVISVPHPVSQGWLQTTDGNIVTRMSLAFSAGLLQMRETRGASAEKKRVNAETANKEARFAKSEKMAWNCKDGEKRKS